MNFLLISSFALHTVFDPGCLWARKEERSDAVNLGSVWSEVCSFPVYI